VKDACGMPLLSNDPVVVAPAAALFGDAAVE
jgi:hypothetical protein